MGLGYYASTYSNRQLQKIFKRTAEVMMLFEEISGTAYSQKTYAQLLIGDHYQEMSDFAVLKDSFGQSVLNDSSEMHLISHELAHQWWGNRITCKSFRHFWLNEGFATFMSAVASERLFGKSKYKSDMAIYKGIYNDLVTKGKDKSLVFPDWDHPTKEDRWVVYYKGAYVLHLLRKKLGEELFWKGVKAYSQKFFDKSVTTEDFHKTMEKVTGQSLDSFFEEWVY